MTAVRLRLALVALTVALFPLSAGQAHAGIATIPLGEYFGSVIINGQSPPAGTTVEAVSPSGAACGTGSVAAHSGSYALVIEGDGDCGNVTFLVNGQQADQQAAPWHLGTRAARLDLTVTGQGTQATLQAGPAPAAASPTASASASAGKIVAFSPGWDLVAGPPGTVLEGASGPTYTFQANDTDYEQTPAGSPLQAGHGYWAQFNRPATVRLPAGDQASLSLDVPEAQFVLIGNPFDVSAAVTGAAALYTYDPAAGYQPATTLQPGQGAWATSVDGTVLLTPLGS